MDLEQFTAALVAATKTHNFRPHSRTGISPYQYKHTRNPRDRLNSHFPDITKSKQTPDFRGIHDRLIEAEYLKASEDYALKARRSKIEVGILVFRKYQQDASKVVSTGPHKVLKKLGSNSWLLAPAPGARFQNRNVEAPEIHLRAVQPADALWDGIPLPHLEQLRSAPE
jgi:hypothetical protein